MPGVRHCGKVPTVAIVSMPRLQLGQTIGPTPLPAILRTQIATHNLYDPVAHVRDCESWLADSRRVAQSARFLPDTHTIAPRRCDSSIARLLRCSISRRSSVLNAAKAASSARNSESHSEQMTWSSEATGSLASSRSLFSRSSSLTSKTRANHGSARRRTARATGRASQSAYLPTRLPVCGAAALHSS